MQLTVASKGGFCFGVKKAVDTAIQASKEIQDKRIYTYGPIIHNSHVIHKLDQMGIKVIDSLEDAKDQIVIVRSHGVPLNFYDEAESYNIQIIDTTCPFVRKVQHLAKKYWEEGTQVIILGNPEHPEVIGINGWCHNEAIILQNKNDFELLQSITRDKLCVLSQTTLSLKKWTQMTDYIQVHFNEVKCYNTICSATRERQEECEIIAKKVDLMIVVGGKNSSNTQKLYEISKKYCKNAIHIESVSELMMNNVSKYVNIGIAAGASTPDWIINEIIDKLEK